MVLEYLGRALATLRVSCRRFCLALGLAEVLIDLAESNATVHCSSISARSSQGSRSTFAWVARGCSSAWRDHKPWVLHLLCKDR